MSCASGSGTGPWSASVVTPAEDQVTEGVVNAAYEPVVTLAVQGPAGQTRETEAVVDTGYNGFLTLPPSW